MDNGPKVNGVSNGTMTNGTNGNIDDDEDDEEEDIDNVDNNCLLLSNNISLISKKSSQMIADVPGKTLETKLTNLLAERKILQNKVKDLTDELEEERRRYNTLNDSFVNNSHHLTSEMQAEIQSNIFDLT